MLMHGMAKYCAQIYFLRSQSKMNCLTSVNSTDPQGKKRNTNPYQVSNTTSYGAMLCRSLLIYFF